MRAPMLLAAVAAVMAFAAAQAAADPVPIGVGGLPHPGNAEEEAVAKDLGLSFVADFSLWDEPKEGDYPWASSPDDPFGDRLKALKLKGYAVCITLKNFDDDKKHMPLYLEGRPLDDPQVLARWGAFLKAFLARYGDSIDYLNFGHKVNAYFVKHENEWPAFVRFVAAGAQVVRKEKPRLSFGVVLKDGDDPAKYWRDLAPACSHLALAYTAPCSVLKKQPTSLALDPRQGVFFARTFETLMRQAGGRKLLLTEVGCPSHPSLDSSPEVQAQFITMLIAWLRQNEKGVAAVSYVGLKDWPYEATRGMLRQAFGEEILQFRGLIRMLTSQGLKDEEGKNKPAYEALKKAVEQYRKR
ncbi:MAG: hypothetical protein NT049_11720 [Planctomycetota bacterium]|nr:hypothetical protein [Planctomycetota bacterium]